MASTIFITGGTGYLGCALIPRLRDRGHEILALVRPASASKLPKGCRAVMGDALDRSSFQASIPVGCTFVQLVGVAHPSPAKAQQFRDIDLKSVQESAAAAAARVAHFIYLSVAHPAPAMHAYIAVRQEGEAAVRASRLPATFLRPWYVLGPGRRWPCLLMPLYWICERIPRTREGARRLGLVTLRQMVDALVNAVETPPNGVRVVEVPEIRASRLAQQTHPAPIAAR